MESFFEYEESQHSVQEVWDDPETIFVVDTNIFLNIYVFHQETRQAIYDALDKIKERLWSPHQVMLEFHRARERHIDKNKRYFQSDFIDVFLKQFTDPYKKLQDLKNQYGKSYYDLAEVIDSFIKNAEKEFSENFTELHGALKEKLIPIEHKLAELQSQLITSKDQDSLYQKLCELYSNDKIGKPFTQPELDELYKEGEARFRHGVPPGYKDKKKDEIYHYRGVMYQSKFGDLILYKQILEHCKTHHIKNVILVSEDNKEDWVDKDTKTLRKEIRGEAYEVAGIQNFIMMNKDSLLTYSEIEKSPQVKEDLERADNIYGESIGLETDLSVIGKKIIDTLCDKGLSLGSKRTILEGLSGKEWSDEEFYYAISGDDLTSPYKGVLYDKSLQAVKLFGTKSEVSRILVDERLSKAEKIELIKCIMKLILWGDIADMISIEPFHFNKTDESLGESILKQAYDEVRRNSKC